MNDQFDFDDATAKRLRRYLDITSHHVHLPEGDSASVRSRAHRRTVRRRRAVTGTVAVATVGSLVVGLLQLSAVSPDETAAPPAAGSVPAPQGDAPNVVDATLTESPFVWKVEDPGQGRSISTMYGPNAGFSGLAVSTAPGRVDPDEMTPENMVPTVWRSDDGITWEQTSLQSPFSNGYFESASAGSALYAVGTAAGIAKSEPNPLQVAIAHVDSENWTTVDLPIDTNALGEYPYLMRSLERSVSALDDGSALVSVTLRRFVDFEKLTEGTGIDPALVVGMNDEGVTVVGEGCDNPAAATTTSIVGQATEAETPPEGTVVDDVTEATSVSVVGSDTENCATTTLSFEELGLPAESLAALEEASTEFFRVTADGNVEAVESPTPGAVFGRLGGPGEFAEMSAMEAGSSFTTYRYDGTQWQTTSSSFQNWMSAPVRVGSATMGWSYLDGPSPRGSLMALVTDDGVVTYGDPLKLFPEHSLLSATGTAAAGDALVSAVSVREDWIAAQGGVTLAEVDGLTVRQDSIEQSWYFVDDATGERVPEQQVIYDERGVSVRNAAGDEIAKFEHGEIEEFYAETGSVQPTGAWSIVTTSNGTEFSVESAADLLGVDEDDVTSIGRVASDGTQVVVVVTLAETYEDGTPKQLTLVGTPRG